MKQQSKTCAYCGAEFIPERRNAMYCSSTCRQYSYLKRKTGEAPFERTHQKEIVNQELKSIPPLILEESIQDEVLSSESTLEPVELIPAEKSEINNQSKNPINMNYNQSNMKAANENALNNQPYEKLLVQEKDNFNDELAEWWNHTLGEQKEKVKVIAENQCAKKYIQEILNLDGKEITREYMHKFLFQMNKAINSPGKQSSDFVYGHTLIGEASVQPAAFLDRLRTAQKSSMIFRLDKGIRAKLEILFRFINGFNMRSPEFWLLD